MRNWDLLIDVNCMRCGGRRDVVWMWVFEGDALMMRFSECTLGGLGGCEVWVVAGLGVSGVRIR